MTLADKGTDRFFNKKLPLWIEKALQEGKATVLNIKVEIQTKNTNETHSKD